jgi:AmmeMemoRadiSam system protein B
LIFASRGFTVAISMAPIRQAAVDGLFYPRAPAALRAQVLAYGADAAAADGSAAARPKMLIVPHAGYEYCGGVAAAAYALLRGRPGEGAGSAGRSVARAITRVVLLGPAHRVALVGLAAPTSEAFETPLGLVALDTDALASISGLPQVVRSDRAHEREHSLEVQLPFLQALLDDGGDDGGDEGGAQDGKGFKLVPLVVGRADAPAVAQVLERLWGGDETLVVISSDLSHYLPYAQARAADRATVQRILALDAGLAGHEACGAAAINGALLVARAHGLVPRLVALCSSGDTAGGRDRVVGYGAFAFFAAGSAR